MANTIDSFRDEYFFLSNFYSSPVQMRFDFSAAYWEFPSGEHAFHALKTYASDLDKHGKFDYIEAMVAAESPSQAKRLGRQIPIDVARWNSISYSMMWHVQDSKFKQNLALALKLLETGDATLIEGNTWGDRVWGKVNGVGQNLLGEILMGVRKDLTDLKDVC